MDKFKIAFYHLVFSLAIFCPAMAGAETNQAVEVVKGKNQNSCPPKILAAKTVEGRYLQWLGAEENNRVIEIQLRGNKEPFYVQAEEEEAKKFFPDAAGKLISVTYELKQEWNNEEKQCLRVKRLLGGKIAVKEKK